MAPTYTDMTPQMGQAAVAAPGQEQRMAMAPTYTEMTPQMGQAAVAASGQEQRTAMAPTYTEMTPQMGQAAVAAQMPTHTHLSGQQQFGAQQQASQMQQAAMPTQNAMMGQPGMGQAALPTQSWSPGVPSPSQQDSFVTAQAAMQTMVLEQPPAMQQASMQTMVLEQPPGALPSGHGSFALGTQAAFPSAGLNQQHPQQEYELVTITPEGYSVTPVGHGQGVPAGIPVFSQMPQN